MNVPEVVLIVICEPAPTLLQKPLLFTPLLSFESVFIEVAKVQSELFET